PRRPLRRGLTATGAHSARETPTSQESGTLAKWGFIGSPENRGAGGASSDLQLTHLVPARAVDDAADDARGLGERGPHGLQALGEVLAVHVRLAGVVLEGLDEHPLVLVLEALAPVEEDVARLGAGGLGELLDELGPLLGPLGLGAVLYDDEDHVLTLTRPFARSLNAGRLPSRDPGHGQRE